MKIFTTSLIVTLTLVSAQAIRGMEEEQNSTIVFPLPIELMSVMESFVENKKAPKALPKKKK
jgi:hypothetical protein